MSERQRRWNKYEAVILLEGLLDILDGKAVRKEVIKRVSADLREMARSQGEDIDEVFRNENGIYFQMQSMESAFKEYTVSNKPATKLFDQVAKIYRTDKQEYEKILKEAKDMIKRNQSCEADFMTWLSNKVSSAQRSEINLFCKKIEDACISTQILTKPLFETTDVDTIFSVKRFVEQNIIFRIRYFRIFSKMVSAINFYLTYVRKLNDDAKHAEIKEQKAPRAQVNEEKRAVKVTAPHLENENLSEQNVDSPSENIQQSESEKSSEEKHEPNVLSVEFDALDDYAYTKPYSFSYFGASQEPCSTWAELYVTFFTAVERNYPSLFHADMSFSSGGSRIDLVTEDESNHMIAPKPIPGTRYIIETNLSTRDIVKRMKFILDLCNIDYQNIVIRYTRKSIENRNKTPISVQLVEHEIMSDQESLDKYENVLITYFKKGFRLNSSIDIKRFKQYYKELYGTEPDESSETIKSKIKSICVLCNDKAYHPNVMLSSELRDKLIGYIDECLETEKAFISR